MTEEDAPRGSAPVRNPFPAPLVAVIALVAALAFLYGTKAFNRNEAAAGSKICTASQAAAARLNPFARGQVAALALSNAPQPMPELTFAGADGNPVKLSSFRGRDILLNLWATWCVPCRREMPTLDSLQAKRGGPGFQVVAVNIDTARLDRPKAFLKQIGIKNLPFYADSTGNVFAALKQDGKALGLPTTILVGKDGCAIGTMAGPAKWDSKDALALIDAETKG
jgi:thiol-disulfide isomerase/thioredoxin